MPTLSNITVKKADGTTDVVYTALQPASGNLPAIFRNNTVGATLAERPTLLIKAMDNGTKQSRRVRVDFSWPLVSTDSGGRVVPAGRMAGEASVVIPQNQDAATIKEQAHQFANLIGSAIIKACFDEGYAPRG